jgi:hypothetical protein
MATKEQAKVITSEQFQAIKTKLANGGVLTAQEWQDLAAYGSQQAEQETKTEALIQDTIEDLKKANIAPAKLTVILESHGLIVLPKVSKPEEKVALAKEPVVTKTGRKSNFPIWYGRDVSKLTGDALKYWTDYKAKGKDYFISTLTEEGKKLYEEDEATKNYINGLFA